MTTGLQLYLDGADVTCHAFAPLSIAWGRDHPGDSFEPRRAVVTFDDTVSPRRGQTIRATLNAPATNPQWSDLVQPWSAMAGTWTGQRALICVMQGRITDLADAWET